jgi:hypothetical protein
MKVYLVIGRDLEGNIVFSWVERAKDKIDAISHAMFDVNNKRNHYEQLQRSKLLFSVKKLFDGFIPELV